MSRPRYCNINTKVDRIDLQLDHVSGTLGLQEWLEGTLFMILLSLQMKISYEEVIYRSARSRAILRYPPRLASTKHSVSYVIECGPMPACLPPFVK